MWPPEVVPTAGPDALKDSNSYLTADYFVENCDKVYVIFYVPLYNTDSRGLPMEIMKRSVMWSAIITGRNPYELTTPTSDAVSLTASGKAYDRDVFIHEVLFFAVAVTY